MSIIVITTIVIALIGLLVGAGLVFAGEKFKVETDPRESAIRDALPGNNCGGCGYAGCDAMAAAVAKGEAPVTGCPVGGKDVAEKLAAVMGTEAGKMERKVAFVKCKGTCDVTKNQGNYVGEQDCRSVVLGGLNIADCGYGCLGLGSCVTACPEQAITVKNGVAVVNRSRCIACGLCVRTCPRGLIELIPADQFVTVQCSNRDRGVTVKQVCAVGCIGCSICARQCEADAIVVDGSLAHINYDACTQCGKCVEKCPMKVITPPRSVR
ncbi:MAG: RnfABCDGE type electron transport complex subunit B [Oscillospiraceae bacterium]|nr:RnfABCDGE type electron transport complex subunit B [Oscillospiraceae bacterium]